MKNEEWLRRDQEVLASVLPRCTDIVASRGEGSYIWDVDGNRYLDFASGIAANSTGHCHPKVVEAVQRQAESLIHTSVVTHNQLNIELAERLGKLTSFAEPQIFFCNSGAEAVDGSLKLARRVTGRSGVMAFQGAFHGRTVAATSLTTAKKKYRDGYTPHLPYVYHAPYGENLRYVDFLFNGQSKSTDYKIGAIIVEPVLGEGGYIVPPVTWLQGLRKLATDNDALLIFDEVQTGIYRTGYPFAGIYFGVRPDVILFAKGVASGMPLGGVIADSSTMEKWPEGTHGSTFGGNPVSCAAALATLDVLEPLQDHILQMGAIARARLRIDQQYSVRGIGLMIAIDLPSKQVCDVVKYNCQEKGLIVISCGPNDNTLRIVPPLTITEGELALGLGILVNAIRRTNE